MLSLLGPKFNGARVSLTKFYEKTLPEIGRTSRSFCRSIFKFPDHTEQWTVVRNFYSTTRVCIQDLD